MKKSIGFLLVFLIIVIVISNLFGSSIRGNKYEKFANTNQLPQNIQNDLLQLQNDIANALNQGSAYSPTTIPPQLFAPTTIPPQSFTPTIALPPTQLSLQTPPQLPLQTPPQVPPQVPPQGGSQVPPRFPPLI